MIKFKALSIASFLGIFAMSIGCNNSTNPPPTPPGPLQLLHPTGGETFKVGQAVTVQWKINDATQISSVEVDLSIDNGKSFSPLVNHSLPPDTTTITWTPAVDQISTTCKIRVKNYIAPYFPDISGTFTLSN
jgi:Developmentally Regulated MAPK Interacting Protein.